MEKFYVDNENKINQNIPSFFEDIQKLFFEAQDTNGNLINSKYRSGYFTVFSIAALSYSDAIGQIASEIKVDSAGVRREVFIKNLILFSNRDFCTMNHEGLHGFNVKHTHRDSTPIDDPNYKYVFPIHLTNNIMAYVEIAYSSWRWQWHLINPNIPEK